MKALIVGQIIGNKDVVKEYFEAESLLKVNGYDAVNPINGIILSKMNKSAIIIGHINQMEECDAVYFLRDWVTCPCARIVNLYASESKKSLIYQENPAESKKMVENVIKSVEVSCGFKFNEIIKPGKKRVYYFPRLILVNLFEKRCGISIDEITKLINRDSRSVKYCISQFPSELSYNRKFRAQFEEAEKNLNQIVSQ